MGFSIEVMILVAPMRMSSIPIIAVIVGMLPGQLTPLLKRCDNLCYENGFLCRWEGFSPSLPAQALRPQRGLQARPSAASPLSGPLAAGAPGAAGRVRQSSEYARCCRECEWADNFARSISALCRDQQEPVPVAEPVDRQHPGAD